MGGKEKELIMKEEILFLEIAKAEIQTIIDYRRMLDDSDGERDADPIVDEIMGDEFNHALIALLTAARLMSIQIPSDGIKDSGDGIELETLTETEETEQETQN